MARARPSTVRACRVDRRSRSLRPCTQHVIKHHRRAEVPSPTRVRERDGPAERARSEGEGRSRGGTGARRRGARTAELRLPAAPRAARASTAAGRTLRVARLASRTRKAVSWGRRYPERFRTPSVGGGACGASLYVIACGVSTRLTCHVTTLCPARVAGRAGCLVTKKFRDAADARRLDTKTKMTRPVPE